MKTKVKPRKNPFEYIRYHSDTGCYHGIVKYGLKTDKFVTASEFPIKVWRIKADERKYYTNMGTVSNGIAALKGVIERHGAYKNVLNLLDEAQSYIERSF
jgi:hypothetical protein